MFLQLESEAKAKARLRPLLARYGLSLVEDESQRATGAELAVRFAAMTWKEAMATLTELAVPYVHRFQALLDVAPLADQPLVSFMVDHEKAVVTIAEREAVGESVMDRQLVVMLAHPFPRLS